MIQRKRGENMMQRVAKIILVPIVLMGSPNVLGNAATFNEGGNKVDLTRTDAATPVYGSVMKTGISRANISDVFDFLREGSFHDAATRLMVTRVAATERWPTQELAGNTARSEPNSNAMLILGLGIALISMIRRLGRI